MGGEEAAPGEAKVPGAQDGQGSGEFMDIRPSAKKGSCWRPG